MSEAYSNTPFPLIAPTAEQAPERRRHQGIPSVEILPSGRLFATYYAGPEPREGPGNYVLLAASSDGGRSWRELLVAAPRPEERAFDPELWLDPRGRLWWSWTQSLAPQPDGFYDGRGGVWAALCEHPEEENPVWSEPRRIADGVQMCKPTVLSDGSWVFPTALWGIRPEQTPESLRPLLRSNLTLTTDGGETFRLIPGPAVPERYFDEHLLVELQDGSWVVYVRTRYGIGMSRSRDRGATWTAGEDSGLGGPDARFALRRLKSGRLLLVNHRTPQALPGERLRRERNQLCAWLSADDGRSWSGGLLIDERNGVSYPDFAEGADGFIYLIYDHERLRHGQILLARFTENDVLAGDFITPGAYSRLLISAFPGA